MRGSVGFHSRTVTVVDRQLHCNRRKYKGAQVGDPVLYRVMFDCSSRVCPVGSAVDEGRQHINSLTSEYLLSTSTLQATIIFQQVGIVRSTRVEYLLLNAIYGITWLTRICRFG